MIVMSPRRTATARAPRASCGPAEYTLVCVYVYRRAKRQKMGEDTSANQTNTSKLAKKTKKKKSGEHRRQGLHTNNKAEQTGLSNKAFEARTAAGPSRPAARPLPSPLPGTNGPPTVVVKHAGWVHHPWPQEKSTRENLEARKAVRNDYRDYRGDSRQQRHDGWNETHYPRSYYRTQRPAHEP